MSEDGTAGNVPWDPAGMLAWAEFVTSYGGPTGRGGRELPDAQLLLSTLLADLADGTADASHDMAAMLAERQIANGRALRGLLRLASAQAVTTALRWVLQQPGWTGQPVTAQDVMDEIAGCQAWLRQPPAEDEEPRFPDAPDHAPTATATFELFVEALQRNPTASGSVGWPVYPWFRAILYADPGWRRDPDGLLRVATRAVSQGFHPEEAGLWCAGGPLASTGNGWDDLEPWLGWASEGWRPARADDCIRWEPWRAAGLSAPEARRLSELPDDDPARPTRQALEAMAALR